MVESSRIHGRRSDAITEDDTQVEITAAMEELAQIYDTPLVVCDGNHVLDVYAGTVLAAEMCRTGQAVELEAANGIVALGVVNAALASIERGGASVKLSEIVDGARARVAAEDKGGD